jgi:hypothetical protein
VADTEQLEIPGTDDGEESATSESEEEKQRPSVSLDDFNALKAQLDAGRTELAEMRGRLEEATKQPVAAKEVPRDLTRAELREMVDRGDISEEQMHDRLEQQQERRLEAKLAGRLEQHDAQTKGRTMLQETFAAYREKLGDSIDTPGHPNRQRLEREYKDLIMAGFPAGDQTEITALARVFGPPTSVAERRNTSEVHREVGGGSGDETGEKAGASWERGLDARQKGYYQKLLDTGQYKGTNDPHFKADIKRLKGGGEAVH